MALFEFEKERESFGNYIRRKRNYTIWNNCWYGIVFSKSWKWLLGKSEFFSGLKQSVVNDEDYENPKYLYQTLKMRNLGDLNDLYNTQDVILLTEIIESRFQAMQNTYGFNPRKCNSASSMSGCIEREMSKIILALPTK